MSVVLGINGLPPLHQRHDRGAALVVDGHVIAAVEEERLSRLKRAVGQAPSRAVREVLDLAGVRLSDIDVITYPWLPSVTGESNRAVENMVRRSLGIPSSHRSLRVRFIEHQGGTVMDLEFAGVGEVERDRAVGTLVLAFVTDPFLRWIYPEPGQYLKHFPEVLLAFGGIAFSKGGVWQLDGFAGVALWVPPGVEPGGDATLAVFEATVDAGKFDDLTGVFGQMDEAHPRMPHWYLALFGVDCAVQGQGLGSRLMGPCLEMVDREHLPAFLDSTNPRNVSFYRRHGFEVTGQWQTGNSPPIISMLRQPR